MTFIDLVLTALTLGGFYALISIGLNLQYGVARILNLSYGELMMLAAFGTFWAFSLLDFSPFVTLVVGTPVAFFLNYWLFLYLFLPLIRRAPNQGMLEINAILSTFGLLFVLQGIALVLWGGSDKAYSYLAQPVEILGGVIGENRLVALIAALVIAGITFVFLEFTRIGRALRAISSNAGAAPLAGIDVEKYSAYAFAVGGVLAGAAGVLISSFININPTVGAEYTMKALIVITMGGIGHVAGGLLAGLALGLAETLCARFIDPGLVTAINFLLFITVLIIRPQGLFGRGAR